MAKTLRIRDIDELTIKIEEIAHVLEGARDNLNTLKNDERNGVRECCHAVTKLKEASFWMHGFKEERQALEMLRENPNMEVKKVLETEDILKVRGK